MVACYFSDLVNSIQQWMAMYLCHLWEPSKHIKVRSREHFRNIRKRCLIKSIFGANVLEDPRAQNCVLWILIHCWQELPSKMEKFGFRCCAYFLAVTTTERQITWGWLVHYHWTWCSCLLLRVLVRPILLHRWKGSNAMIHQTIIVIDCKCRLFLDALASLDFTLVSR